MGKKKSNGVDIDGMFKEEPITVNELLSEEVVQDKKDDGAVPVSKVYPEELLRLAEINKMKWEDIYAMYDESYAELVGKGVKENIEHFAINGTKNAIRKLVRKQTFVPKYKATAFTGFIIGDNGLWDKAEQMRNDARRFVESHSIEEAIAANLIDQENRVLDQRDKVYGRANPNYLKPLPETTKIRSRTLHLIARKNGEDKYMRGTIQTNDSKLSVGWSKVKFFVPCQTFGIIKEEEGMKLTKEEKEMMTPEEIEQFVRTHPIIFRLNSSQAEDTMSVFKAVKEDMDVDQIFMDLIGSEVTPVADVEKRHELTKDAWDRIIFVRGIVTWINRDRPSPWGSVFMGLMSDGEDATEVRISVPSHLSIDFGEDSEIIVIGKTRRTKTKDDNDKLVDADVVIDAYGLYPLKGLATPSEVGKPEQLEDDTEVEGWIN
jgi:hypothetical protein